MARKRKITDRTTQYAKDVVSGKIIAGKFVRLACQRHLDDLKFGKKRGLAWKVKEAEEAIQFFPEMLTISEGEHEGEPFNLLPWHIFVVGSIFGWKDVNGLRRFRFVWLETGKGQAKSPLMAAIGILIMSFSDIPRASVYCIGEDKNTARVVFGDAVAMVRGPIPEMDGETLESIERIIVRGKGELAYMLEDLEHGSKMAPRANNESQSGPRPDAVLGDEIHEMKTNKAIETWSAAIVKKAGDPIMILGTNTSSIDQEVGTEYSEKYQKVLTGEYTDDAAFAYIARTDDDDDPFEDESCWFKSLPALGITFPIENIRKMVEKARYDMSARLGLERLYFGIPVGSSGFWMEEGAWFAVRGPVDEKAMKGKPLHLALDLSQKNDLTALSGCWVDNKLVVKNWYWTRDYGIDRRSAQDRIQYRELEAAGEITIIKARTIDYGFVAAQVQQIYASHDVVQMAVDSAYIDDFIDACDAINFPVWIFEDEDQTEGKGLKIVRHKQGAQIAFPKVDKETGELKTSNWLDMPHSIGRLVDKILDDEIIIDDGRLTTICAANAVTKADAQDNKYFDKKRSRGRIDGIVTTAMAVGSATSDMNARESVYENRGIRTL